MQILKLIAGVMCFALAALSLMLVGLMILAWIAQYSISAAKSTASPIYITIGQWTLSGWQIYAVASSLVILTLGFIFCGVYVFRSSKTTD
jgi:hypothetical protein